MQKQKNGPGARERRIQKVAASKQKTIAQERRETENHVPKKKCAPVRPWGERPSMSVQTPSS